MSWKDTPVCGYHAPRDGQEFSGRTLYAPACRRAPPPAAHMQCLLTAIPSHMCFSPRAQTFRAHGDPQRHVRPTTPTPKPTRVIAGLVHRHTQQRDGSIAHTGTSGTTPHWSRTTASHAGVIWHDHPTHAAAGYGSRPLMHFDRDFHVA